MIFMRTSLSELKNDEQCELFPLRRRSVVMSIRASLAVLTSTLRIAVQVRNFQIGLHIGWMHGHPPNAA
jgi:hypothetical protein